MPNVTRVKTELMRFIAASFETPGMHAGGISATSLGTKYKQVVQSTATKVRAALKRMLKQLDEDLDLRNSYNCGTLIAFITLERALLN